MDLYECILTKNDCYKKHTPMTPKGIVVHSTGANNPYLKRYVQPDDGILGYNKYQNDWNRPGVKKCVHAFIGKDKNGKVKCYKTLPFDIACWGVGGGKKGSYNYNPTGHIQFEVCEDNLKDENYFNECFNLAADFCVFLCKLYDLDVNSIVGHHEAYLLGYGSNHGDPDAWMKKFGKDMNWFRNLVKSKMGGEPTPKPINPIVKSWQITMNNVYKSGLVVDGSYGPLCKIQANKHQLYKKKLVALRIRNDYVVWLQRRLKELGYNIVVDGSFWKDTDKIVRQFQRDRGLKVDGYVGANTVRELLK